MADVAVPAVDNTNRFTGRADAYVKYRRSYPPEAIRLVAKYFHLPSDATILDLGSGTGILSRYVMRIYPIPERTLYTIVFFVLKYALY